MKEVSYKAPHTVGVHLCEIYRIGKIHRDKGNRLVVVSMWEKGKMKMGNNCSMGFLLGDENVLELD